MKEEINKSCNSAKGNYSGTQIGDNLYNKFPQSSFPQCTANYPSYELGPQVPMGQQMMYQPQQANMMEINGLQSRMPCTNTNVGRPMSYSPVQRNASMIQPQNNMGQISTSTLIKMQPQLVSMSSRMMPMQQQMTTMPMQQQMTTMPIQHQIQMQQQIPMQQQALPMQQSMPMQQSLPMQQSMPMQQQVPQMMPMMGNQMLSGTPMNSMPVGLQSNMHMPMNSNMMSLPNMSGGYGSYYEHPTYGMDPNSLPMSVYEGDLSHMSSKTKSKKK